MKKGLAFTLSEVLVTLVLIGVIATLTIPYLYGEFNKNKWTITYKRSFAETYNALKQIALDDNCSNSITCTHVFDDGQDISTRRFGEAMTSVMSVSENCGVTQEADADGNCFSHGVQKGLNSQEIQTIRSTLTDAFAISNNLYTFKTNRGVSYALLGFGSSCLNGTEEDDRQKYINAYVDTDIDGQDTNPMLKLCGFIVVDVNGPSTPNVWGRDVFGMWITDKNGIGVYPFGGDYDKKFKRTEHCLGEGTDSRGCAAQLIEDGWKMKY